MEKLSFIIILTGLMVISMGIAGVAAEFPVEEETDSTIYGEVIYTTLADEDLEDEEDEFDLSTGFGFKVGGEMEVIPGIIGSAEYFRVTPSDSLENEMELTQTIKINAARGNVGVDVSEFMAGNNIPDIILKGGLGYYFGEIEFESEWEGETETESWDLESSLGFVVGGEISQEVADNVNLQGGVNYRMLETSIDEDEAIGEPEDIDFNGIEVSGGISYNF